jgi:hypothetical protein
MPEIVLQRAISNGIVKLKTNEDVFKGIFAQYMSEELDPYYGTEYVDGIWTWFSATKLPVVQSFSFDPQKVPCLSIHLASEQDDEGKAAAGDFFGMGENSDELVNPMTVMLDIGIHASKSKDHVLWMYYIVNYLLYKEKKLMRSLGLQLTTFSASEYNKDSQYMAENVWSRWVRFKCTVQNFLDDDDYTEIDSLTVNIQKDIKASTDNSELVPAVIPK